MADDYVKSRGSWNYLELEAEPDERSGNKWKKARGIQANERQNERRIWELKNQGLAEER